MQDEIVGNALQEELQVPAAIRYIFGLLGLAVSDVELPFWMVIFVELLVESSRNDNGRHILFWYL